MSIKDSDLSVKTWGINNQKVVPTRVRQRSSTMVKHLCSVGQMLILKMYILHINVNVYV